MGTTSTIMVVGAHPGGSGRSIVRLFQYYDGYPEHVLPLIAGALERLVGIYRPDPLDSTQDAQLAESIAGTLPAESCAYLLMAQSVSRSGVGIRIDEDEVGDGRTRSAVYFNEPSVAHLGQDNLDWVYVIDLPARAVNAYSTRFRVRGGSLDTPVPHIQAGLAPADRLREVAQLRWQEDAKASYADYLNAGIMALESTGFALNTRLDTFGDLLGLNAPSGIVAPPRPGVLDPSQHGLAPMF